MGWSPACVISAWIRPLSYRCGPVTACDLFFFFFFLWMDVFFFSFFFFLNPLFPHGSSFSSLRKTREAGEGEGGRCRVWSSSPPASPPPSSRRWSAEARPKMSGVPLRLTEEKFRVNYEEQKVCLLFFIFCFSQTAMVVNYFNCLKKCNCFYCS